MLVVFFSVCMCVCVYVSARNTIYSIERNCKMCIHGAINIEPIETIVFAFVPIVTAINN